uniref:Amidase domain-containing protein n=1 Tax=Strigamia maritima TaxID=126957 RepID=T1IZV1_STRMM
MDSCQYVQQSPDLPARCSQVVVGCVNQSNNTLIGVGVLIIGVSSVYYMWNYLNRKNMKRHLCQSIEDRKVKVRLQKESVCMGLTGSEQSKCSDDKLRSRIVALSAEQLLQDISEGRFTVQQVLQAYRAEAYRADLRTNCITEFLDEAEDQARYLDTVDVKGPLHGLPISIKETYHLKCHDCTAGLAKLIGVPSQRDAVLVTVLKKLGAIPFVRTNIVQTSCKAIASMGNCNPIYGETVNPHCKDRIPGGSSCGEGALIGLGGSLIGLGTDVGGSLRIPAAMCGIYSIKPTQNRLSGLGVKKTIEGLTGLHDCPGLLAREMQALVVVFRALVTVTMFQADPRVVPLTFQKDLFNIQRPLRIGYYDDDGCITPTPGCRRAVYVAKGALEKMGHEVTCFTVPQVEKAFELTMSLFAADGGKSINKMLENEPYVSKTFSGKGLLERFTDLMGNVSSNGSAFQNYCSSKEKSTSELWKLLAEREEYVDMFIQTWKCLNLDALIAPGYALPAYSSNYVIPLGDTIFITMLYNMLNFPVGSVPVTRETDEDQKALDQEQPEDGLRKCMKKAAQGALGLPLGVQVIGLSWQEEMVLRVMKDLELGLKTNCEPEERCASPKINAPNTVSHFEDEENGAESVLKTNRGRGRGRGRPRDGSRGRRRDRRQNVTPTKNYAQNTTAKTNRKRR